jgi:hypothetical protein
MDQSDEMSTENCDKVRREKAKIRKSTILSHAGMNKIFVHIYCKTTITLYTTVFYYSIIKVLKMHQLSLYLFKTHLTGILYP